MSNLQALVLFNLFVLGLIALDLEIFQRRPHGISFRESIIRTSAWVALALASNVGLYFWRGAEPALEFLAGYILEKSLSLDNMFVFTVIFSSVSIPAEHQHRVLSWGVVGALVLRGALIVTGVTLLSRFHWALYLFGAFLVFTGIKILRAKREKVHPERNLTLRLALKVLPLTERYEGPAFFVRREGKYFATPLLLALVMVETADVLFALDSIPAIFAVTEDPLIIYTSNVFALLGLRAMYFLLAGAIRKFRYLRGGLSLLLIFVGAKMFLTPFYRISTLVSLAVICSILAVTISLSVRLKEQSGAPGVVGKA